MAEKRDFDPQKASQGVEMLLKLFDQSFSVFTERFVKVLDLSEAETHAALNKAACLLAAQLQAQMIIGAGEEKEAPGMIDTASTAYKDLLTEYVKQLREEISKPKAPVKKSSLILPGMM